MNRGDAPTLDAWLEPRLEEAPAELAEAVWQLLHEAAAVAVERHEGLYQGIPGALAAAALCGFDGVVDCEETDQASRKTALRLLAADATLTYAFEAAADLGLDVLELAARTGVAGALGARIRARGTAAGGGSAS